MLAENGRTGDVSNDRRSLIVNSQMTGIKKRGGTPGKNDSYEA